MEVIWSFIICVVEGVLKENCILIFIQNGYYGNDVVNNVDGDLDYSDEDESLFCLLISKFVNLKIKFFQLLGFYYFGDGNLFVFFMCLVILLIYKDYCMQKKMDYNILVMYFDKLVWKYDFVKIFVRVRILYVEYFSFFGEVNSDFLMKEELKMFWCN